MAKVKNMTSDRGNKIANQFIIQADEGNGEYFQSYNTVIAHRNSEGKITLDERSWDYSVTTGKYRNIFLNEKKADTEKKIKSGEYKLADLNS